MGRIKGSLNPQEWLSGPDPIDHKLYTDCQRARAQAWYRGEEWFISEQEYIALWRKDEQYKLKGRGNHQLCLIRKDYDLPWTLDNVEIRSRREHYQICSREKIGKFATGEKRRLIKERLANAKSRV